MAACDAAGKDAGIVTLPADVQAHVDAIRSLLGVPACKLTIDMDDAGNVQHVRPELTYRRLVYKSVDSLTRKSAP